MKDFFKSKKGKIFIFSALGLSAIAVIVVVAINLIFRGYRTIAVEEITGIVTVKNETDGLHNAYEGMHLQSGDEVTIGENSRLILKLDGDKYVVADAGTHFWVEASGNSKNKEKMRTYIYMDSGSILNRLDEKLGVGEVYEVQTPNSAAAVRGTTFRVTVYKDSDNNTDIRTENYTRIEVLKGVVNVELKTEEGKKTGENRDFEAGESGLIHSNPEISEFVDGTKSADKEHTESVTVVKKATCTEEGLCEIRCALCNEFLGAKVLEKTEHTEGEWVISKETSCVQAGTKILLCSVCESELKSEEIPLEEHQFEEISLTSKDGCKITTIVKNICSVCSEEEILSEKVIENHSYGVWITEKEASCSAEGVSARTCSVCGIKETQSIAKTEHIRDTNEAWKIVVSPTCLQEGQKKVPCGVCGEWIYQACYSECSREYTKEGHDISGVDYTYTSGYQNCDNTEVCVWCGKSVTATHVLKVDIVTNSDGSQSTKLRCATCGVEW